MRKYTFSAAIADFYISAFIIGGIFAFFAVLKQTPNPSFIPFLELFCVISFIVIYYSLFRKKVSFLSPGEMMLGAIITGGEKQWFNPYGITQIPLYLVMAIVLIGAGNTWDHISNADYLATLKLNIVIGRYFLIGFVLLCMVMVGRGNPHWLL